LARSVCVTRKGERGEEGREGVGVGKNENKHLHDGAAHLSRITINASKL